MNQSIPRKAISTWVKITVLHILSVSTDKEVNFNLTNPIEMHTASVMTDSSWNTI